MDYEISMDFYHDWAAVLQGRLEARGYTVDEGRTPDDICTQYYGLFQRLISQRQRQVKMSRGFSCPSEHTAGLELLIEKIKTGADLSPYLSSLQADLDYTDGLLNDWGIHHLHLGTTLDSRGLIERTGPILFAIFTDDCAYFINVYVHGREVKQQPWAFQEMIQVVDKNWPHLTEPFKFKGMTPARTVTDEEYLKLRRAGVTVVSVGGMSMAPMGGGITTARTSVSVRTVCDDVIRQMKAYEQWVRDNVAQLIETIKNQTGYRGTRLHFSLAVTDTSKIEISENNSGVSVAQVP